tara:strand:+ start:3559 stop:4014 length:456 start_codon:yes stop_codon:yes gene_type:complete
MIDIHFEGRIKNRKRIVAYVDDVINDLFPREFKKRNIEIGIKFQTMCDPVDVLGYASVVDDDSYLVEIARKYEINGVRYETTERDIANVIAHELVHVKQFIRKELDDGLSRWKGQDVPIGTRGAIKIPYLQQPWEQEAFRRGNEYAVMFWD